MFLQLPDVCAALTGVHLSELVPHTQRWENNVCSTIPLQVRAYVYMSVHACVSISLYACVSMTCMRVSP
jgi:hypothetical protein